MLLTLFNNLNNFVPSLSTFEKPIVYQSPPKRWLNGMQHTAFEKVVDEESGSGRKLF